MPDNSALKHFHFLAAWLLVASVFSAQSATAQNTERWFQVEISIFSNESLADRDEEQWQADRLALDYPNRMQRLQQLSDLLLIEDLMAEEDSQPAASNPDPLSAENQAQNIAEPEPLVLASAPETRREAGDFRFFDFQRDSFVQLPASESNFQQTNRALERTADHRLLFHGLWRQPLLDPNQATPIYIEGGLRYGEQHELQGNITLRFNDNRDRIVIDTDLWLAEFSATADPDEDWQLPNVPAQMKLENIVNLPGLDSLLGRNSNQFVNYGINRVFHMQQSRDMRSTEFHYIDHPAMGLVILVEPYEVPAIPQPEFDFENDR